MSSRVIQGLSGLLRRAFCQLGMDIRQRKAPTLRGPCYAMPSPATGEYRSRGSSAANHSSHSPPPPEGISGSASTGVRPGTATVTSNRRIRMAQVATTMSCCQIQTKLVRRVIRGGAVAEWVINHTPSNLSLPPPHGHARPYAGTRGAEGGAGSIQTMRASPRGEEKKVKDITGGRTSPGPRRTVSAGALPARAGNSRVLAAKHPARPYKSTIQN